MPYGGTTDPGDVARLYVGDTNPAAPLLPDEAYVAFLAASGNNPGRAAVLACYALDAKFGHLPDKAVGPLRISYSPSARSYLELAAALKNSPAVVGYVAPLSGGITDPATGSDIVPFFTRSSP